MEIVAEQARWYPFSGPAAAGAHDEYTEVLSAEGFQLQQLSDQDGPRLYLYGTAGDVKDAWNHLFCLTLAQRRLEMRIVHSLNRVKLPEPGGE